jgi:hypothetical protein
LAIEEGEVQAKSTENIFDKIIAENFPNLRKEMVFRYRRLLGFQTDNTRREYTCVYYS